MIPELMAIGAVSGLVSGSALGMAALETVRLGRAAPGIAGALELAFGDSIDAPVPAEFLELVDNLPKESPPDAAR